MVNYKTVFIDKFGVSYFNDFGNNDEMALAYAKKHAEEPMSSCMVYKIDGKKRKLVWSKLEGMVDG